jgi:mannose-6-phosphate isomerase-like protein (cupin superfamily)
MRFAILTLQIVPVLLTAAILTPPGALAAQCTGGTIVALPSYAHAGDDAAAILRRYTDAWRGPAEMALPDTMQLGFRVHGDGGGEFNAVVPPDGPATLAAGPATGKAVTFETDMATLRKIDSGQWNVMTAMAQGRSDDPTPMKAHFPEGFTWTPENRGLYMPFIFHFWNRGRPEVIRFGPGTTRTVHGGEATLLYYDRGLRSAWYQLGGGVHVNADRREQTNPFPSLFIATRGSAHARIDGIEHRLREGEAVLVPAGMTHEVWTAPGECAEVIIVMFGAGA